MAHSVSLCMFSNACYSSGGPSYKENPQTKSDLKILESEVKKEQFAVCLYLLYHCGEQKNWVRGSSEC